MNNSTSSTVYLKDYKAPNFVLNSVQLDFDLYDDYVIVRSEMEFQRINEGDLYLNADELELVSIHLDNTELQNQDFNLQKDFLKVTHCPDHFKLQIVTRIEPQKNTKLSGLYRSNDLFCTQCEAEGFRRITYFPDRPDVLTTFSTRITADKKSYPILLSNGNLVASGEAENGRHWVKWDDPFKKPSYLFALVAGNLAQVQDTFLTSSGRTVSLHIYVEPGNEDKCNYAMQSLQRAMRWDEQVYGREYDLDIFMIVAVSDFNMGAMENKGLNIFNSKYILARPETATDEDFAGIESVVAHEYFHNWTGNRVTCRDWFQLSLKEGLTVFRDQEFSRDMNSRDVDRIKDVKALRTTQFPEDAGAMAHPVRPESYEEINNFYTATIYNKGAEVIRMQHTLLGAEAYRKAMDLYFERHDGQAVTIDDFVAAMQDASGVDLTQFKLWYSQAGTPVVNVKTDYSDGEFHIQLEQSCPETPESQQKKPFHIPINMALYNAQGESIVENQILDLKKSTQKFVYKTLEEKPVLSLLRDFSAPVKLNYEQSEEELISLLRFETNGFAKWEATQNLLHNALKECLKVTPAHWKVSGKLIAALNYVMQDESLDMALRAELLSLPSFEEIAGILTVVDVSAIEKARDELRLQIGQALYETALQMYQRLEQIEDHQIDSKAFGRRKLKNVCLWLMMKARESQTILLCQQQFTHAKTMSDQQMSFTLLVNCANNEIRAEAIANFYLQWSHNDLVLDKWFAIQASSEQKDALNQVKKLLEHPDFSLKNPNKVRSVIGAFIHNNPRHFHHIDGQGYQFLTENLLLLDKINPQIAARMATPFTRWKRYDGIRQELILKQLKQLQQNNLSRDLGELVSKSLSQAK